MLFLRNMNKLRISKFTAVIIAFVCLLILSSGLQAVHAGGGASPLIETGWLADNMKNANVRIVHVGSMNPESQKYFNMKHIPGSIFVSIGELMGALGNGTTPPDKAMSEAMMGRLGISDNTHVVVVGGANNPFAITTLWLMKYNGHKTVSYLNGGVGKWIKENRAMTETPSKIKPTKYSASPDNSIYSNAENV
nr:hypothetical protein [Candidatus Brocadiales bacterium]